MNSVVLMDGGHEAPIRKYAGSSFDGHPLWISRYIVENPDALLQACQDYIQAGAEMVVSATYQASVEAVQNCWTVTEKEALDIIKRGVTIYKEAVAIERAKGNKREVSVVGCIGPYGACLHDGSEYSGGSYVDHMTVQQLIDWHRPKFEAVIEAGADYLLFCTTPSVKEAEALLSLLKEHPGMKAILSFSAQNEETTVHGEKLSAAACHCWHLAADQILAIGVNCLHPRLVDPLLRSVRDANPHIPLFVRVNTTEIFNVNRKQWESTGDPKTLPEYCRDWLNDLGLKYVSGCCRTSVEDILNFRHEIDKYLKDKINVI